MPKKIKKGKRPRQPNLVPGALQAVDELGVQAAKVWGAAYAEDPTTRDAIFAPIQQPALDPSGRVVVRNGMRAMMVGMSPPLELDPDEGPELPEVRTHTRLGPPDEPGRCPWHPRHSAWHACTVVGYWIKEEQGRFPLGVYYCTAGIADIESKTGRSEGGIYLPHTTENRRRMPVSVCTYAGMFGLMVAIAEIPALLHTKTAKVSDVVAARTVYRQTPELEKGIDPRVWAIPNAGVQWGEAEAALQELGLLAFVPDFGLFLAEEEFTPEGLAEADAELEAQRQAATAVH